MILIGASSGFDWTISEHLDELNGDACGGGMKGDLVRVAVVLVSVAVAVAPPAAEGIRIVDGLLERYPTTATGSAASGRPTKPNFLGEEECWFSTT